MACRQLPVSLEAIVTTGFEGRKDKTRRLCFNSITRNVEISKEYCQYVREIISLKSGIKLSRIYDRGLTFMPLNQEHTS